MTGVRLSARKGEIRLVSKGEKSRTVPVHVKLREALAEWLAERPSCPGAELPALFTSFRGTRMTTDALADVITAWASTNPLSRGHAKRPPGWPRNSASS